MPDQKKAYLYGLATVLLWSTVASAFKISLQYQDHAQLLLFASSASLLTLGAILLAQGRLAEIFRCSAVQYRRSLLLGLLNPFAYYLILFKAYALLPAQEAQPLNYTWALTLVLLSIPLLKQRIGWQEVAAMLVSYSGVWVISTRGAIFSLHFSNPLGVALALLSTLIWALYWIFSIRDDRDPVVGLLLNFACGLPFVLVYCLLFSELRLPAWPGLLGAGYVGLFEMGITFVLWLRALKLSENTARVGNLIFLSPFLSLVFIHFLVGEEILASTYAGLVLIVGGLLIRQLRPAAAQKNLKPG
ncbi:membrane protein [Desulfuromonas versatilis]|uniref:Membrane protein n=1 Tax=Desulfuromonas versatilis TaxID=2802975 RepID=A0ABM8I239_9BACT|nr:DMT family transporter [Desulfuromonas versatilis]BCR06891.1 membrane protein [Desulfuromonas versatilis]